MMIMTVGSNRSVNAIPSLLSLVASAAGAVATPARPQFIGHQLTR